MTLEAHVPAFCMVGFGFSLEQSATLKFDHAKDIDKQRDVYSFLALVQGGKIPQGVVKLNK